MKRQISFFLLASLFMLPGGFFPQEPHLDVPYVSTNPKVVAEMLRLANVGRDDILYDLGCGDGRIVITAAQMFGTRGVGIDMNPERIKESNKNAAAANVTNLVRFVEQDLFKTDFHEATVVTLYLLTSVNLRLRPILFAQLRPGARVVSHDFSMDAWKPDDSAEVKANGMTHEVYFWIIPANVSGIWEWSPPEGGGKAPFRLEVEQQFQSLRGRLREGKSPREIKDLNLAGDRIRFSIVREDNGKTATLAFDGRASGNAIAGTAEILGSSKPQKKPWKAQRVLGTMKPIEGEGERKGYF